MGVAKTIEISSDSEKSFEDAARAGIEKAASTVAHIESAWIKDHMVLAKDGKVTGFRVRMRVTFRLN